MGIIKVKSESDFFVPEKYFILNLIKFISSDTLKFIITIKSKAI
jgi:hypothetical protein